MGDATLSIIVYRGDPVDFQELRHTALFLTFSDGKTVLMHATGGTGLYAIGHLDDDAPRRNARFIQQIMVGIIRGKANETIRTTIRATPVNNSSHAWNCQHWVGDALLRLSNLGWISSSKRSTAVEKMVDVIWRQRMSEHVGKGMRGATLPVTDRLLPGHSMSMVK